MAARANVKAEAHRLVDGLSDEASRDDVMYAVYVRQAIEQGRAGVQAGRVMLHDQVLAAVLGGRMRQVGPGELRRS